MILATPASTARPNHDETDIVAQAARQPHQYALALRSLMLGKRRRTLHPRSDMAKKRIRLPAPAEGNSLCAGEPFTRLYYLPCVCISLAALSCRQGQASQYRTQWSFLAALGCRCPFSTPIRPAAGVGGPLLVAGLGSPRSEARPNLKL